MKILYVTTVGMTMNFFKALVGELIKEGHAVDIACNEDEYKVDDFFRKLGCKVYHIGCVRSPLSKSNLEAVKELKKIVYENHYDIVHCHTPVAGVCTRLACKSFRKNGLKVIYTAHGFHFYQGAPLKNWLVYYPIEKYCSRFTDVLITINQEDYALAKKKMKAKKTEYVPGVGIDVDKFRNTVVDRTAKRKELGIPKNAFLLLSVGELNANKNHQIVIRALAQLNDSNIHYMIAGKGDLHDELIDLANRLGVAEQVHLLGYRNDVAELYKTADVYCLPSIREGLNVSVMEAMASGLPVICSCIRGNTDLISKDNCFKPQNCCAVKAIIKKTFFSFVNYGMLRPNNKNLPDAFSIRKIKNRMNDIYQDTKQKNNSGCNDDGLFA